MQGSNESDPQAARSARSAVLSGLAALTLALASLAWWGARRANDPSGAPLDEVERGRAEPASLELGEATPAWTAADDRTGSSDSVDEPQGGEGASAGLGEVVIAVVDAQDGRALPNVPVALFSEEPVRRSFGVCTSDAEGFARFTEVPAPLALAYVRRSERYAAAVTAVRGAPSARRESTLRLSTGSSVSGRVIDDEGQPIEGARIDWVDHSPWPDAARPAEPVAFSDAQGRYRIERVIDLPRLVTVRDGELFAAAWSQVTLEAVHTGGTARVTARVRPGREATAPDLELPRAPSWNGVLLDAQRQPVAGALLSTNRDRQRISQVNLHAVDPEAVARGLADGPGMARFQLLPGETLTDVDGRFELVGASTRGSCTVITADGRVEDIAMGAWDPGATIGEREWVLSQREGLRFRLVDPEGHPILGRLPFPASADERGVGMDLIPILGGAHLAWTGSKIEWTARTIDGRDWSGLCTPLGDGTCSLWLPAQLSDIESWCVQAPGYRVVCREPRGRLRPENAVAREVAEPLDRLALTLELDAEPDPRGDPQDLLIRMCALAPEGHESAPPLDSSAPRPPCCGVGLNARLSLRSRRTAIELPMRGEGPYWLTLMTTRAGRAAEVVVEGPFGRDEGPRTLLLTALPSGPSPFDRVVDTSARKDPFEATRLLRATLCVFDARSQAPIVGARVWPVIDPLGRETLLARSFTTDAQGIATLDGLSAGTWTFTVVAPGHRAATLGPWAIARAGPAEIDFGELRLEPID